MSWLSSLKHRLLNSPLCWPLTAAKKMTDNLIEHLIFTKTPFPVPSNAESGSSLRPDCSTTSYLAHGWNHKLKRRACYRCNILFAKTVGYMFEAGVNLILQTQWAQRPVRPQLSSSKPLRRKTFSADTGMHTCVPFSRPQLHRVAVNSLETTPGRHYRGNCFHWAVQIGPIKSL